MSWTYFLMWHDIPPKELDEPFATGSEPEALAAAQKLADESGKAVDVLRGQQGVVESGPYRTLVPRKAMS